MTMMRHREHWLDTSPRMSGACLWLAMAAGTNHGQFPFYHCL